METISKQLKIARAEKRMTQVEFAKWLGINLDSYQNIEQGRYKPKSEIFIKIMRKIKIKL